MLAILPVRIADEPKETLVAPLALIAFTRVALPLGYYEPWFAVVVPIVSAGLSLVCALWLMSAGARANQFEHSTLVSEILVCERGVLLSFVWMGLASGVDLAEVGGLFYWWSGGSRSSPSRPPCGGARCPSRWPSSHWRCRSACPARSASSPRTCSRTVCSSSAPS